MFESLMPDYVPDRKWAEGRHHIPLYYLKAAEPYQREIDASRVRFMVENFSLPLVGVGHAVVYPTGRIALCDFHHRGQTCVEVYNEAWEAEIQVWHVQNVAEAAALSEKIQGGCKSDSSPQKDKRRLIAGDAAVLQLKDILETCGYELRLAEKRTNWNTFTSLCTVRGIWGGRGPQGSAHLKKVLTLVNELWEGQIEVTQTRVLRGMSDFLDHIAITPGYKEDRLMSAVQGKQLKVSLDSIQRRQTTEAKDFADHLMTLYNMNLERGARKIYRVEPE